MSKNHVHILVNAPPTIAASEIIPLEEFPHLKNALGATLLGARLFLRHSLADDGRDD
nr:hypothetical protein [Methylomicrobium lacus]